MAADDGSQFVERRRWPRVSQAPLGEGLTASPALVPLRFETSSLPTDQQFAAWQAHMSVLLTTHLPESAQPDDGFSVTQHVWNLDGILIVQQDTSAFHFERSANEVRFSPIDHWMITIMRSGQSWTGMNGQVVENHPGLVEIRSLGQPFSGRTLAASSTSLIIPADAFADRGGLPITCNNVALGGHRAQLLIGYLTSVEASLGKLAQGDLAGVKANLRELVFDAIAPLVEHIDEKDNVSQIALMTKARRFIQNNLASPDLTPDALGRELALSRTRLYELFETFGGVANYIRRRRMLAAHAMLADPADTRKVAEVGEVIGFDSAANFSRAFTHQFGYSPSNIRKQTATGAPATRLIYHRRLRSKAYCSRLAFSDLFFPAFFFMSAEPPKSIEFTENFHDSSANCLNYEC
ncbi:MULTISPECIES: helix-turn-helix domain-containing protein [Brucella]|uniref:Helix-turn-helix, AraC type n=6 Tax=Brucella TaxID=234 RepID=Q2YKH2_BRUA2|nr:MULTISPECIES: AraC family transcriptional regulator [Brucella]KFH18485.1 AraC family transcriptional regulator [Brucella abortus LMN1]KFH19636.1 AraC family transcriptional regulator [Brucella abortus LMN2]AIJ50746.1 helix-turn-helix domain protein [Brucella abortus]AIJ55953.1 helix-turn-helix domain protein [Brucella abortus]AIJ59488.1 helix-turn-helix domain protein [Brucella abortus]